MYIFLHNDWLGAHLVEDPETPLSKFWTFWISTNKKSSGCLWNHTLLVQSIAELSWSAWTFRSFSRFRWLGWSVSCCYPPGKMSGNCMTPWFHGPGCEIPRVSRIANLRVPRLEGRSWWEGALSLSKHGFSASKKSGWIIWFFGELVLAAHVDRVVGWRQPESYRKWFSCPYNPGPTCAAELLVTSISGIGTWGASFLSCQLHRYVGPSSDLRTQFWRFEVLCKLALRFFVPMASLGPRWQRAGCLRAMVATVIPSMKVMALRRLSTMRPVRWAVDSGRSSPPSSMIWDWISHPWETKWHPWETKSVPALQQQKNTNPMQLSPRTSTKGLRAIFRRLLRLRWKSQRWLH